MGFYPMYHCSLKENVHEKNAILGKCGGGCVLRYLSCVVHSPPLLTPRSLEIPHRLSVRYPLQAIVAGLFTYLLQQ